MGLKPGQKHSGQFKKGQSGNPGGKPQMPDDLKALMNATSLQAKRYLCESFNTSLETLKDLAHQKNVPGGLAMIAACVVNCAETGDNRILATFLDRLIGKPKEVESFGEEEQDHSKDETINQLVSLIVKERK